jgi:NMD protein affecting ribosome stability and mRNA decay
MTLLCAQCGREFEGRKHRRFCSCRCANIAHMPVRLTPRTCPVCGETFKPRSHRSKTCSRSCGAQSPAVLAKRKEALALGRVFSSQLYAKRLAARLLTMTKGQIWREAYVRGYNACRQRMRRGVAA